MMHPLYAAYTVLTSGLFFLCFPPFWLYSRLSGYYSKDMKQRLGILPRHLFRTHLKGPRIWIHAVSLGEVRVAVPILNSLRRIIGECNLVLSSTTLHGKDLATQALPGIPVIIAPP